jgi:topoisomerase IA-like protein
MNVENMHLKQGAWPESLTPELRQQLLLDKIARAKQETELRKKYPSLIRAELNIECCHEQECEHH